MTKYVNNTLITNLLYKVFKISLVTYDFTRRSFIITWVNNKKNKMQTIYISIKAGIKLYGFKQ